MDLQRIHELLQAFLIYDGYPVSPSEAEPAVLTKEQLQQLSTYLDLLLRWNSHVNLTAVRKPEDVVTRHFGESLFAARHLFSSRTQTEISMRLIDFGSGAGFPGLPIKVWVPEIALTLIEANQKKATFLREVIRKLNLHAAVFSGRAENFDGRADIVTLRAVERFENALRIAARLVAIDGRLALLIGEAQIKSARELITEFNWMEPVRIPQSVNRVLLVGMAPPAEESS
jgi:16S rRNA (guanine527-N7)-methyltransferase